jgi:hypothetical protein
MPTLSARAVPYTITTATFTLTTIQWTVASPPTDACVTVAAAAAPATSHTSLSVTAAAPTGCAVLVTSRKRCAHRDVR